MDNYPRILSPDTAVRLDNKAMSLGQGQTFLAGESVELIAKRLTDDKTTKAWTEDGVTCQALSPGGHWIKGKVRFAMIFEPNSDS